MNGGGGGGGGGGGDLAGMEDPSEGGSGEGGEGGARAARKIERRQVDFVMCCGHFLGRDEDIFEYIERCATANGGMPAAALQGANTSKGKGGKANANGDAKAKASGKFGKSGKDAGGAGGGGGGLGGAWGRRGGMTSVSNEGSGEKDVEGGGDKDGKEGDSNPAIVTTFETPVTCTVGRKRSGAGYFVNDSDDIAELLACLTNSLNDGKGRVELLQFDTESSMGSARSLADLVRQGSIANMSSSLSTGPSRHGSMVDVARLGRNQSVSNISDNSSELHFQHTRRGEEMITPPSPIGSPALPP